MPIDPITGLDLSTIPLIFNQIPLASDPVLAPEWDPQGRYTSVLHPDNIPTVFSTLQAHNNTAPKTAQSLSTDGKKNLNVNLAGSSPGSGVGTVTPNNFTAGAFKPTSPTEMTTNRIPAGSLLCWASLSIMPAGVVSGSVGNAYVALSSDGFSTEVLLYQFALPGGADYSANTTFILKYDVVWPGGLNVDALFPSGGPYRVIIGIDSCTAYCGGNLYWREP